MKINTIKPKLTLIATIAFLSTTGCVANPLDNRNATVTVRVVDDENNPVQNVLSSVYHQNTYKAISGMTDTNGMYSVFLNDIWAEIIGSFKKDGYYNSKGVIWNWGMGKGALIPPADTNFTVVLKRIINPVPSGKKDVVARFPRLGAPIGYDLEIGDWVFPDGKGKNADMLLTAEGFYNDRRDYSFQMSIEFTGEFNGIQSFHYPQDGVGALLRSELPPPAVAPELGYVKTVNGFAHCLPPARWGASPLDKNRKWIFRIRTEVDDDGNVVSANYGWMFDDIIFGINSSLGIPCIMLKYYHNPNPHSHSLEPKEIADRQNRD